MRVEHSVDAAEILRRAWAIQCEDEEHGRWTNVIPKGEPGEGHEQKHRYIGNRSDGKYVA